MTAWESLNKQFIWFTWAPNGKAVVPAVMTTRVVLGVAGGFAFAAVALTLLLVWRQLRHWTQPEAQRHVVRIVCMVPIYALASWFSLLFPPQIVYFNLVRDAYEGFVLYAFLALLVHYLVEAGSASLQDGCGDEPAVDYLHQLPPQYHPFPLCWLPPIYPGYTYLLWTRRLVLQYALVKPLAALVATALELADLYDPGSLSPTRGYLWLTLLVNLSLSLCLYALIVFYDVIAQLIAAYDAFWKLFSIKAMLFFMFWQTTSLQWLYAYGAAPPFISALPSDVWDNALVCVELFGLALVHLLVYDVRADGGVAASLRDAWRSMLTWGDVRRDVRASLG